MKTKGKCILIVDDEPPIQRILRRNLTMSGYDVLIADNGVQALELVRLHEPDLILLDLWLPGEMDGMSVCAQVRQWSQVPIIVVSARTDEKQKVQALDKGADDYLTKPFNNDELLARVRACLRRVANVSEGMNVQEPEVLTSEDGYVSIDIVRRLVRVGTQEMKLTPTEFELLHQLMLHTGKVMTHRPFPQQRHSKRNQTKFQYKRNFNTILMTFWCFLCLSNFFAVHCQNGNVQGSLLCGSEMRL